MQAGHLLEEDVGYVDEVVVGHAELLELLEPVQLGGDVGELVVRQVERAQVAHQRERGRQLGQVVVRHVQQRGAGQEVADLGGQDAEVVLREVDPVGVQRVVELEPPRRFGVGECSQAEAAKRCCVVARLQTPVQRGLDLPFNCSR